MSGLLLIIICSDIGRYHPSHASICHRAGCHDVPAITPVVVTHASWTVRVLLLLGREERRSHRHRLGREGHLCSPVTSQAPRGQDSQSLSTSYSAYGKRAVRYEAIVHIAVINESRPPTYETRPSRFCRTGILCMR